MRGLEYLYDEDDEDVVNFEKIIHHKDKKFEELDDKKRREIRQRKEIKERNKDKNR